MINCLTLAVEDINAKGGLLGRKISQINYDTQSNIQLYTQYATEAATKDHVAVGIRRDHVCLSGSDAAGA